MTTDALVQYLRAMNWTNVLILQGDDPSRCRAGRRLQRLGRTVAADVVDRRPFTLAADPRTREGNNVQLLTGGVGL